MKILITTSLLLLSLVSCFDSQKTSVEFQNSRIKYRTQGTSPEQIIGIKEDTITFDKNSYNVDESNNDNNQNQSKNFDKEKWLNEVEEYYKQQKQNNPNYKTAFDQKDIDEARNGLRQAKNTPKTHDNKPCGCCPRYDYVTGSNGKTYRIDRGGRVGPYTDQEIRDLRRQNPDIIFSTRGDRIVR